MTLQLPIVFCTKNEHDIPIICYFIPQERLRSGRVKLEVSSASEASSYFEKSFPKVKAVLLSYLLGLELMVLS